MSDIKCPFCQQDLCKFGKIKKDHTRTIQGAYCPHCKIKDSDIKLWQELIRTRKALDVAVDTLKRIDWCAQDYAKAQDVLDEITALEQKDVK